MTIWMPRKKPLYAPMLATFGGGSIQGFKASGGGEFAFSGGTAADYHDSTQKVSAFSSGQIYSHLTGGAYTTDATTQIAQTINTGQSFNLGSRAIFPVVFRMGIGATNNSITSLNNAYAMLCMLYIDKNGNSRLGPTYKITNNEVTGGNLTQSLVWGTTSAHLKDEDRNYFTMWPNEYAYDSSNSTSFSIATVAQRGDSAFYYYYQASYSVDINTLQITKDKDTTFSNSSNNTTSTTLETPWSKSGVGTNVQLLNPKFIAQGNQVIPLSGTNRVLQHFGGVSDYHNLTSWKSRVAVFTTANPKTAFPQFIEGREGGNQDPVVAGASVNSPPNAPEAHVYQINWDNAPPFKKTTFDYLNGSGISATSNASSGFTTAATISNLKMPYVGYFNPQSKEGYIVTNNSTGATKADIYKSTTGGVLVKYISNATNSVVTVADETIATVLHRHGVIGMDGRNILYTSQGSFYNYDISTLSGSVDLTQGTASSFTLPSANYLRLGSGTNSYNDQRGIIPTGVESFDDKQGGFYISFAAAASGSGYERKPVIAAYAGK